MKKSPKTLAFRVNEVAIKYGKFDRAVAKKAFRKEYATRVDSIMRTARRLCEKGLLTHVGPGSYVISK